MSFSYLTAWNKNTKMIYTPPQKPGQAIKAMRTKVSVGFIGLLLAVPIGVKIRAKIFWREVHRPSGDYEWMEEGMEKIRPNPRNGREFQTSWLWRPYTRSLYNARPQKTHLQK